MPKKLSINAKLHAAINRMNEMADRLESIVNQMMIRLEAIEVKTGSKQGIVAWTWKDARIDTGVVRQLEALLPTLTGREETALRLMIQTCGRIPFVHFARSFDGWVDISRSGTVTVSEGKWGGCRRGLNDRLKDAGIPVEIGKPKGSSDVLLMPKAPRSERSRARSAAN